MLGAGATDMGERLAQRRARAMEADPGAVARYTHRGRDFTEGPVVDVHIAQETTLARCQRVENVIHAAAGGVEELRIGFDDA